MKTTMYDIIGEALVIFENLEDNGGELTPELEKQLTITESELQSKGIAYLEVIKDRTSHVNRIDQEIKRLQAMKKADNNIIDRLEFGLLEAQKTFGDFDLGLTTITTRKSESIEVEDVNLLPKEYKVIKVVESADKNALKEAIKKGEKIDGVRLVENQNLRIK